LSAISIAKLIYLKFYVGCFRWRYNPWQGLFYIAVFCHYYNIMNFSLNGEYNYIYTWPQRMYTRIFWQLLLSGYHIGKNYSAFMDGGSHNPHTVSFLLLLAPISARYKIWIEASQTIQLNKGYLFVITVILNKFQIVYW
jgi:hypothetical protein